MLLIAFLLTWFALLAVYYSHVRTKDDALHIMRELLLAGLIALCALGVWAIASSIAELKQLEHEGLPVLTLMPTFAICGMFVVFFGYPVSLQRSVEARTRRFDGAKHGSHTSSFTDSTGIELPKSTEGGGESCVSSSFVMHAFCLLFLLAFLVWGAHAAV